MENFSFFIHSNVRRRGFKGNLFFLFAPMYGRAGFQRIFSFYLFRCTAGGILASLFFLYTVRYTLYTVPVYSGQRFERLVLSFFSSRLSQFLRSLREREIDYLVYRERFSLYSHSLSIFCLSSFPAAFSSGADSLVGDKDRKGEIKKDEAEKDVKDSSITGLIDGVVVDNIELVICNGNR